VQVHAKQEKGKVTEIEKRKPPKQNGRAGVGLPESHTLALYTPTYQRAGASFACKTQLQLQAARV
jgi:hypothetical protein